MKRVYEINRKSEQKKLRVAAYCRVSTERDDQQNSLERQTAYFRQKLRFSENRELTAVYADTASGTSADCRPGFLKMMEDCRAGRLDRVITKSLSRFARNTKECLKTLRELKQMGVTVLFEKEGIDTARVSDEIMITIMEGLAQEESASISRNTRWSIRRRMANGTFGIARVPYGFQRGKNGLETDAEKAAVVRNIFSMYLSGTGAKRIAAALNDQHIASPTGGKWNNVTVLKLLRQEKYIGDIHWQKTYSTFMGEKWKINHGEQSSFYLRDCLPPIISREDFMLAQKIRINRTRQPHHTTVSPFRGKTKCICGRSYSLKAGSRSVWECSGKYDLTRRCSCPSFTDAAYHAAWNRLCEKLGQFADELLLPCIALFERMEEGFIGEERKNLQNCEEELCNRRYVLVSLCFEGIISAEKLMGLQNRIEGELEETRIKRAKLEKQSNETVRELSALHRFVTTRSAEELPDLILTQALSDGTAIHFTLLGGAAFREVL